MNYLSVISFRWKPNKLLFFAIAIGFLVLFLSFLMTLVKANIFLPILLHDLMILVGFSLPLYIIKRKRNYSEYGLHFKNWILLLTINLVLGFFLLMMFIKQSPPPIGFTIRTESIWQIVYILLAGIFETILFYSFLRTVFEKSFGIIPAILLAAAFYSLHHAGFQPEFGKLFLVGIMYASVFRIGKSPLIIYPFFWGVGGCYDVMLKSTAVSEIVYPMIRSIILIIIMGTITIYLVVSNKKTVSMAKSPTK